MLENHLGMDKFKAGLQASINRLSRALWDNVLIAYVDRVRDH